MAKQRTPEEILKAQQEGNAFIQQREQLAAQIDPTGKDAAAPKQAAQQLSQKVQGSPFQQQETGKAMQKEEEQIVQQAGAGEQPKFKSLQPAEMALQKLPFGSSMAAIATAGGAGASISEQFKKLPERAALLPENQRQGFLQAESKKIVDSSVLKRRLSFEEKAGVLIESIPVVSSLARKFAGNLLTTPSKKVDDFTGMIEDLSNEVTFAMDLSIDNPQLAMGNVAAAEEQLNSFESKIQQLIIISPELRANPEEVDKIASKVLKARQNIFSARQAIATTIVNNKLSQNI